MPKSSVLAAPSCNDATAAIPASSVGIPIVVNGGATIAAIGTSSQPTTLTSAGTAMPRVASPATTPRATRSLKAITAVAALSTTRSTAPTAASNVGVASGTSTSCTPAVFAVRRTASRRSTAAHDPCGPPR